MTGISPGAVQNYLATSSRYGAARQEGQDRLIDAAGSLANTARDVRVRAALRDELTKRGLPPELAQDPRAATIAIIEQERQNRSQAHDESMLGKSQAFSREQQDRGLQYNAAMSGFEGGSGASPGTYNPKADPRVLGDTARGDADASRARAMQEALGQQTATLAAPVTEYRPRGDLGFSPAVPSFDQMKPMDRAPTPMEITGRAAKGGYMQDALKTALGALPEEREDPFERARRMRAGGLAADQEFGVGDFAPKAPEETPEQRVARIRAEEQARAEGKAAGTPKEPGETPEQKLARLEAESAARARGTAQGTPPKPPTRDQLEQLVLKFSPDEVAAFKPLLSAATQGPFGTAPTAASIKAFNDFVAEKMAKYGTAAGGNAGTPPGDPAKVKALQDAGWTWDGEEWQEPK